MALRRREAASNIQYGKRSHITRLYYYRSHNFCGKWWPIHLSTRQPMLFTHDVFRYSLVASTWGQCRHIELKSDRLHEPSLNFPPKYTGCGGGKRVRNVTCVDMSTNKPVEDSLCSHLEQIPRVQRWEQNIIRKKCWIARSEITSKLCGNPVEWNDICATCLFIRVFAYVLGFILMS